MTRYRRGARFYDLISAEPVYRAGRRIAIPLLHLQPGDTVLDLGCGTGLNFPLLEAAIGATGRIVGVDASSSMLDRSRQRASQAGWDNVELICANATTVGADRLREAAPGGYQAAITTYALSLMDPWPTAWTTLSDAVGSGGQIAVVDMQRPVNTARVWVWLAQLACTAGGADIDAQPWTALENEGSDVVRRSAWAGHIQVAVGRLQTSE